MDALLLAEINNLLLGQRGVVLDLVDSRRDCDVGKKLLKISLAILSIPSLLVFRTMGKKGRKGYIR